MSTELKDLLEEREDIKAQRDLAVKDNIEVNRQIDILNLGRKNSETYRKRTELLEQRRLNAEALILMDKRLSEIKIQIREKAQTTLSSEFYKAAQEILPPEIFDQIKETARRNYGSANSV